MPFRLGKVIATSECEPLVKLAAPVTGMVAISVEPSYNFTFRAVAGAFST
ncbi:MAG: hypothetical protein IKO66_07300 [Paludibacteraceae bacterium]|nr:hypothetical protein [Paludibacteraceae bacterium]